MDLFNDANMGGAIFAITALPFVIIVLIFVIIILRARKQTRASQSWSTASGRVLAAYNERRTTTDSNGSSGTAYYPVVHYEYSVNGRRYEGNRIRFGMEMGRGSPKWGQSIVDSYPTGGLIPVYYDPADPSKSVLDRENSSSNRVLGCIVIGIVAVLAITGAFMFVGQGLLSQVMNLVPH